ncbi:hypothetical protein HDU98_002028 [Podochytrium sp. JEL0797]|nr:hypothetical protein HDU98_002028 [Podochytrium sp. JEL0797]
MISRFSRGFSTLRPTTPVALSHDVYNPKRVERAPVVVMHGLFGAKQNWRSIAKQLTNKLHAQIITVDLRNHGDSPHTALHNYPSMSTDVFRLCDTLGIHKFTILGHSMGGKTAMHMALSEPARIENLISVDMAPIVFNASSLFGSYIDAMRDVENARVKTMAEADAILQPAVPELGVRQFLLTNLKQFPGKEGLTFRINLDTLQVAMDGPDGINGFPLDDVGKVYNGPALFVRGNESGYCRDSAVPGIRKLFPRAEVVGLDGGHWIHSEKPNEFMKAVEAFLVK